MREAMRQVLARLDGVEIVAELRRRRRAARRRRPRARPDVVVTDVRMPPSGDDEGIRIAQRLARAHPEIGVVVLSQYADAALRARAARGAAPRAAAYLLKERVADPPELRAAIEVVARGGSLIDPAMVRLLARERPPSAATRRSRS